MQRLIILLRFIHIRMDASDLLMMFKRFDRILKTWKLRKGGRLKKTVKVNGLFSVVKQNLGATEISIWWRRGPQDSVVDLNLFFVILEYFGGCLPQMGLQLLTMGQIFSGNYVLKTKANGYRFMSSEFGDSLICFSVSVLESFSVRSYSIFCSILFGCTAIFGRLLQYKRYIFNCLSRKVDIPFMWLIQQYHMHRFPRYICKIWSVN